MFPIIFSPSTLVHCEYTSASAAQDYPRHAAAVAISALRTDARTSWTPVAVAEKLTTRLISAILLVYTTTDRIGAFLPSKDSLGTSPEESVADEAAIPQQIAVPQQPNFAK